MANKNTNEVVEIRPIEVKQIPIRIVGDSPLIVHAWDPKAKKMMLEAQQKVTKTKAKEIRRPFREFIGSMYWLTEMPSADTDEELEAKFNEIMASGTAKFGFTATAVKQAANSAAFRLGWVKNQMELRGSYFLDGGFGDYFEIKYEDLKMREDMVRIGMGSADLRYRAEFSGWYADLILKYNANSNMTIEQILNCINAGGFACGIGEWRPEKDGSFGMYHVALADEMK